MNRLYHFTNINNLHHIIKEGLHPKNGEHSKVIGDFDEAVCFSENYEGAIAINMSFEEKFEKRKEELQGNNLKEYLGECVYLSFNSNGIDNLCKNNVNGFFNGKTEKSISPENLSICVLKDQNGNLITEREQIVYYMMSKTPIDNFRKIEMCGVLKYKEDFMERIEDYYNSKKEYIKKFKSKNYSLEEIKLEEYIELVKECDDRERFISSLISNVNTGLVEQNLVSEFKNHQKKDKIEDKVIG